MEQLFYEAGKKEKEKSKAEEKEGRRKINSSLDRSRVSVETN